MIRNRFILLMVALWCGLRLSAVEVTSTAGGLSSLVTDHAVTSLTVTGTMDARDFLFIADELPALTTLDLSGATVATYSSEKPLFGTITYYPADEVPAMSLAGKLQLTTLKLPSSVKSIGVGAVANCPLLSSLTLPSKLEQIGSYAFAWDTSLKTLTPPWYTQSIGDGAFSHCTSLQTVKIYAHVRTLGAEAFLGCTSLATFTFSTGLTSIGERAFVGTALQSFDLSAQTGLTSIGDWAFAGTGATSVVLPPSVTDLGAGTFLYMRDLSAVNLPSGLKEVPDYLFAGDASVSGLTSLPSTIEALGDYAFYNWSQVNQFTIPSPVYYLGERSMAGMTGLKTLVVQATKPPTLGGDVWDGVKQIKVMNTVPSASKVAYATTPQWEEFKYDLMRGDVNLDGSVDVGDLNVIINYMLGSNISGTFIKSLADDDSNGEVDIADVNCVLNLLMGRSAPVIYSPNSGDGLALDGFGISSGETLTLELALNNSQQYSAMQFDLHLPDGLELVDNTMEFTERMSTHELAYVVDGDVVRVVGFSADGDDVEGATGTAVLRFDVYARHAVAADAMVRINQVVFATPDCRVVYGQPTAAEVMNTSGVKPVSTSSSDRVYAVGNTLVIETSEAADVQVVAVNGMMRTLTVESGVSEHTGLPEGFYIVRLHGKSHKVAIR